MCGTGYAGIGLVGTDRALWWWSRSVGADWRNIVDGIVSKSTAVALVAMIGLVMVAGRVECKRDRRPGSSSVLCLLPCPQSWLWIIHASTVASYTCVFAWKTISVSCRALTCRAYCAVGLDVGISLSAGLLSATHIVSGGKALAALAYRAAPQWGGTVVAVCQAETLVVRSLADFRIYFSVFAVCPLCLTWLRCFRAIFVHRSRRSFWMIFIDFAGRLSPKTALVMLAAIMAVCVPVNFGRLQEWRSVDQLRAADQARMPDFHNAKRDLIVYKLLPDSQYDEASAVALSLPRDYVRDLMKAYIDYREVISARCTNLIGGMSAEIHASGKMRFGPQLPALKLPSGRSAICRSTTSCAGLS